MADPQRSSLTIQGGPLGGRSFLLPEGAGRGTIGSDPGCRILVPLPGVSARHVLLIRRDGSTFVVDQGSARGAFINDTRLAGEQELHDGDLLWLGPPSDADSVAFKCRLAAPGRRPEPAGERVAGEAVSGPALPLSPPPAPREPATAAAPGDSGFFVGEPVAPPPAPRMIDSAAAPSASGFFIGESVAPPPAAPDEPSNAFFVGDEPEGSTEDTGAVATGADADEAFFVESAPAVAPAVIPAATDDFFVAEETVAIAASPHVLAPPVKAVPSSGAEPVVMPIAVAGAAAAALTPQASDLVDRPPIAREPRSTRPAVAPRAAQSTPGAGGRTASAAGIAGRARTSTPVRAPVARGGATVARPRRSGRGVPVWVWPLGILALAAVAGGVVAVQRFVGRPRVDAIEPRQPRVGNTVVLTGSDFGASSAERAVLFGEREAQIVAGDAQRIEVKVPDMGLAAGEQREVAVRVRVGRKRSAATLVLVREVHRISGLSPDVALPGEEVLVAGAGWAASGVEVLFEGTPGQVVVAGPDYVRVRVPGLALPHGSTLRVVVVSGQDRSEPAALILGRLPVITSIEPRAAALGDVVSVRGRGLRGTLAEHSVLIGGLPALVVGASAGGIDVLVPSQAPGGEHPVELRVRGYANAAFGSLSVSAAADPLELRFTAEPAGEAAPARAVVATALGPAFLLSPASGRSAAVRAAEAVKRLNAAVASLRERGDAGIELRLGGPTAVIGLTGVAEPLLEVANEDAVAYSGAVARGRTPAVTRGRVANWWVAELRDLTLLLGRGERPRHTVAFGPDARFLAEVYDVAARSGGGVMRSVVVGLRPPARDGLRAMALRVPASVPEPRP